MDSALIRLMMNNSIIAENGNAVLNVILCRAVKPPAFDSNGAHTASRIPQPTVCHFRGIPASFVAILVMTNIPESAEVTKKTMMIAMVKKLTILVRGRYSKKRNIKASGSVANLLNAPSATFPSNQIALFPKTAIQIKLNIVGMIKTAATNSRIVRPLEILAINSPTYGDHEIHHAQYSIVQS